MARVRPTARITRDGEEAVAAKTAPISKVMRQSGLVVTEGASEEGAPAAKVEQADIEEGNVDEEEIDYNTIKPSATWILESLLSLRLICHDDKARLLRGSREEADSFWRGRNYSEAKK
jgi:hypothetical protein